MRPRSSAAAPPGGPKPSRRSQPPSSYRRDRSVAEALVRLEALHPQERSSSALPTQPLGSRRERDVLPGQRGRSPRPAAGPPDSATRGCAAGARHETPGWPPASAGAQTVQELLRHELLLLQTDEHRSHRSSADSAVRTAEPVDATQRPLRRAGVIALLTTRPPADEACQWPSISPHSRPVNSPLVAIVSPRWWPSDLPIRGHRFSPRGVGSGSGQGRHPLAGGCLGESVAVLAVGDQDVRVVQEPLDGRGRERLGHQLVEP